MSPLFRKFRPIQVESPSDAPPLNRARILARLFASRRLGAAQASLQNADVNPGLCSLPDELIRIIFLHLEAYETGGTLRTPRHAYALALTSTRFFRLFVENITRITPDLSNDAPLTLSRAHILFLIRLSGNALKELHLPRSSFPTLAHLPKLCPNVEKLTVVEDRHRHFSTNPLAKAMTLPLRSLSITNPSRASLRMLVPPPPELYLRMVNTAYFRELDAILRDPPKTLFIQSGHIHVIGLLNLLKSVIKACPNIEDFTMKIPDISTWIELPVAHQGLEDYIFLERALELLETHRFKDTSKCMKIVLEGDAVALTRLAHPEANIEITNDKQTFICEGDRIFAKRLPLWNIYLSQDLSRLTEISVGRGFNLQWKELLADIRLARACVEDPSEAVLLSLNVDILEVPLHTISAVDWTLFDRVREVRLMGLWDLKSLQETVVFFESLTRLLDQFQGKVVWVKFLPTFFLRERRNGLKSAVFEMQSAIDRFEARGGDAGTLRALVARINWMKVSPPAMVPVLKLFCRLGRHGSVTALSFDEASF